MNSIAIEGQLNAAERALLTKSIREQQPPPERVIEVGTWLGGGSTLHILHALQANGRRHLLWGVEYDPAIFEKMMSNLQAAAPDQLHRFTARGDHPDEQIVEFDLLDARKGVGSQLMARDARERKGKWLVPYLAKLDHWQSEVLDPSPMGLLHARNARLEPSPASKAAAAAELRRLKRQFAELVARILPHSWRAGISKILPSRLLRAMLRRR